MTFGGREEGKGNIFCITARMARTWRAREKKKGFFFLSFKHFLRVSICNSPPPVGHVFFSGAQKKNASVKNWPPTPEPRCSEVALRRATEKEGWWDGGPLELADLDEATPL